MNFYDKNGLLLQIGDRIIPTVGRELLLVSVFYVEEYQQECMFGQQTKNPLAFSVLTQEDLSKQWIKVEV